MKPAEEKDNYYLIKGYKESQGYLFRMGGMYVMRNKYEYLNWLYVSLFQGIYIFFLTLILPYTVITTFPKGDLFSAFQALHYWFTAFGYSVTGIMYHLNRGSMEYVLICIGKGFYVYDEPEEDEEAKKIISSNMEFLRKLTRNFVIIVFMTGSGVMLISPIVEFIKMGGRYQPIEDAIVNPYLPLPFISFWDEMVLSGYITMYVLSIVGTILICLELIALSLGYTSLMITFTTQFTLLNLSILKIELRATKRYKRLYGVEAKSGSKYWDPVFQECMYFCLTENIKHHQALLKWIKEAEKFLGWALLCTFTATSILLAASGYLLMMSQNSIFNAFVLVQVQVLELIHSYLFCWWGENLAVESSRLPVSLYSTPWIYCNHKFKMALQIMICKTNLRVIPKDPVFKLEASLEIYKSIISTGYSYFNLLRSMSQ